MSMGTGGGGDLQNCDRAMTILASNCNSCHSKASASAFGDLDLESAGVASRLVDKPASTNTGANAKCGGKGNLINKGTNPATGIFIDKINFKAGECGDGMPYLGSKLPTADLQCLTQWATWLAAGNN